MSEDRRHSGAEEMTREEAERLKTFDRYCTCGGHAWQINGRPQSNPHMPWCPQKPQYDAWWAAINVKT